MLTASNSQREGDDGRGREEKEEDREQGGGREKEPGWPPGGVTREVTLGHLARPPGPANTVPETPVSLCERSCVLVWENSSLASELRLWGTGRGLTGLQQSEGRVGGGGGAGMGRASCGPGW